VAKYSLPYGKTKLEIDLDDRYRVDLFLPKDIHPDSDEKTIISSAIRNPENGKVLSFKDAERMKVAITINDKTRPVPNNVIFPPLLRELNDRGIKNENITILIATGTHIPMSKNEHNLLLNEDILQNYHVTSHDCDETSNLIFKGTTTYGTKVYVNSIFDSADIKVVVGNIEPHHFAGFSGGAKSASIGVCGRETITHNHILLKDPKSCVGRYEDNPLRQDIEEIGQLIEIDFALNVILNEKKEILHALFGSPKDVMKKGIQIIRENELIKISEPYDLVIASAGGYPKDINLYQAQKALTHASLFCKDGGMVLLAVACSEGVGSQSYVDFMQGVGSHKQAKEKFEKQGFRVGPHKSYQFAMIADRIDFKIKSEIEPNVLTGLLIESMDDFGIGITEVLNTSPSISRIAILPYATATIPQYSGDEHNG